MGRHTSTIIRNAISAFRNAPSPEPKDIISIITSQSAKIITQSKQPLHMRCTKSPSLGGVFPRFTFRAYVLHSAQPLQGVYAMPTFEAFLAEQHNRFIDDLKSFVAQPSVAATGQGMIDMAAV